MATVIKLQITVAKLDNVLTKFNQIQVFRSTTGINGTYTELTTAANRINLQQGVSYYEFDDTTGATTYWYKTRYYHNTTFLESGFSPPRLGDDPAVSTIMSVSEMKDLYLFGLDLTNDAGEPFPDIIFDWGIRRAIDWLEHLLDIKIKPTELEEYYDYYRTDYQNWTFVQLREYPVLSVEEYAVTWPAGTNVIVFPNEWVRLRKDAGQVNVVPTSGTLSQVLLTAGGSFLPLIASGQEFVPEVIRIKYTAGFAEGEVPITIRDLVGKLAAFGPLNIAGDLIVGAGIASKSLSIDGLSQSINTTSSATNAGYGARLIQYAREIKEVVPTLQRYYKGIKLTSLG